MLIAAYGRAARPDDSLRIFRAMGDVTAPLALSSLTTPRRPSSPSHSAFTPPPHPPPLSIPPDCRCYSAVVGALARALRVDEAEGLCEEMVQVRTR